MGSKSIFIENNSHFCYPDYPPNLIENNSMKYIQINILDKLDSLQSTFIYSTKLAEALNVSRRTLLNWRQKPHSISAKSCLDMVNSSPSP